MIADSPTVAAPNQSARRGQAWPGARTFRSARFRTLVGASIWLIALALLAMLLARQAADPAGQYAFDFTTYHAAAADILAGRTPYPPQMLEGPIPAQGELGASVYKYPPPFAQLLAPLAVLPLDVAAAGWLVLQAAMLFAGTWLALRAGGARASIETVVWTGVAATLFLPGFDTLWKGNVSGLLALLVGVALRGGVVGGFAAATATLLKTTPLALLAPLAGRRRDALRGGLLALPVLVLSVALSPGAWLDFVRVLPNLVEGSARFPTNLAPDNVAALLVPAVPALADVTRGLALVLAAGALIGAIWLARRDDGWPAAVGLAVAAMLLLPSSTWYHYLAVLLPVAAFSWPRAGRSARLTMVGGAATVSAALVWLPLALLGGGLMLAASVRAVWPPAQVPSTPTRERLRHAAERLHGLAQQPELRRRLALYLSLLGYGLGLAAAALLVAANGGIGYDSHAYWLAGRNVLEGQPLYWPHDEGALGAFRYPPLFAQLWAPLTLLPAIAFSWLWRVVCLLSLRYLAGSWRNVGLWLLVPLVWTELSIANVTFPVAALCVLALRGQAAGVAAAAALKFGPALLMPYLWLRRPETRRSLVIGSAALAAAAGVSFALDPGAWLLYAQALTWMGASSTESFGVIRLFDDGVLDAAVRGVLGLALVLIALQRGSDRLAFAATVLAAPVLALWRLTPLLALPRLGRPR